MRMMVCKLLQHVTMATDDLLRGNVQTHPNSVEDVQTDMGSVSNLRHAERSEGVYINPEFP